MPIRPLILAVLAVATAAGAAAPQSRQQKKADAFTLDSVAPSADATPAPQPSATPDAAAAPAGSPTLTAPAVLDSAAVTAPAADAPAPAAPTGMRAVFTLDTPIADLIADPAAKAVLDKDLPGLSTDENLDKFAKLGLRQFQPLTGGQLTDAMLVKVARDLLRLSGPMLAPVATVKGNSKRDHDASR